MKFFNLFSHKINLTFILATFTASACEEIISLDIKNIIQGTVVTIDEYSAPTIEGDSVHISITDTPFFVITDENGFFKFSEVAIGKYILTFDKKGYLPLTGYAENTGMEDILRKEFLMFEESSTRITNFKVEQDGSYLVFKGKVTHTSPITVFEDPYGKVNLYPWVKILTSESSDIAIDSFEYWHNARGKSYSSSRVYPICVPSGSEFEIRDIWGSGAYFIAYGLSGHSSISKHPSNIATLNAVD